MRLENLLDSFENSSKSRLKWFCPPRQWSFEGGVLRLLPDANTDYWQRTHYGFQNDNGHFLFTEILGDFILTTQVRIYSQHQYDQAGLMVRISPDFWLKTSIEFEPDQENRLGAVVTRYGYSDWSTQDISKEVDQYQLRVRRQADDYTIDYRQSDGAPWMQIRMAHLERGAEDPVQCGLYACSPIDSGFEVQFDSLNLQTPA